MGIFHPKLWIFVSFIINKAASSFGNGDFIYINPRAVSSGFKVYTHMLNNMLLLNCYFLFGSHIIIVFIIIFLFNY